MATLLVSGNWTAALDLLLPLYSAGHCLILTQVVLGDDCPSHALHLVALGAGTTAGDAALSRHERPWLCWNRDDDADLALAACGAGALAVLPATATGETLLHSVCNALAGVAPPPSRGTGERRYARDAFIRLDRDAVLEVVTGVVAQAVIHADGTEVLLGLYGPGQLLVGHPDDGCCLHLVAHTDATVARHPWATAAAQPRFAERLRARLRQIEAWSAAQARHYLDQRVLGILGLLAEQFGTPGEGGILIGVRITHAQLAAAVGATRTTVTRILGDLRGRGLLATVGTGPGERFCLLAWSAGEHGLH